MSRNDFCKYNYRKTLKKTLFTTLIIIALTFAAGCVGDYDSYDSSSGQQKDAYIESMPVMESAEYADLEYDMVSTTRPETTASNGAEFERKVITTSDISLKVANVSSTMDTITGITLSSGGFVSRSSINAYDSGERGYMTIRIPQGDFEPVMSELKTLGKVTSLETSGQDVTEEYVDLDARVNILKNQETRLLEILNMTTTVEEVLDVERELGRVRGEIESITGRLKYLDNMVSLATIDISIRGPEKISSEIGIVSSIKEAVSGFIITINVLIVLTGYLLPLIILLGLIWIIAKKWRNR